MVLFRHVLRIEYIEKSGSIENRVVNHLEGLRSISPNRLQEFVRNAVINEYTRQQLSILADQASVEERGVQLK